MQSVQNRTQIDQAGFAAVVIDTIVIVDDMEAQVEPVDDLRCAISRLMSFRIQFDRLRPSFSAIFLACFFNSASTRIFMIFSFATGIYDY